MIKSDKIQLFMRVLAHPLRSSNSRVRSESGQAVVEYILVLVVTLGIILGVMYQFSSAFKKYVQSYFGEYVACLLETGELPTLGGEDGANAGICNASFEPFSLKNGRPLADTGSSGDSSSGSGGANGARNRSGGRRGNGLNTSKVTRGMMGRNGEAVSGESSSSSGDSDNKKRIVKRYVSNPSYSFRTQRRLEEGQMRLSNKWNAGTEDKEKKPFTATIDASGSKGSPKMRGRKLAVDLSKFNPKKPIDGDVGLELSFGDYIRYIIIFGIIIMIVIFFGGQLMQIKKNYEGA